MLLNTRERTNPPVHDQHFKTVDAFVYSGIQLVPKLDEIVNANYNPLMESISNTVESLPIYLIGKINILKMIFFP